MLPYYCLFALPVLIALVENDRKIRIGFEKKAWDHNHSLVAFFLGLFCLLALRDLSCGADLVNYQWYYETIAAFTWQEVLNYGELERGYVILNKVVSLLSDDFRAWLVVCACLSVAPVLWFYRKEAEGPVLTMVLFASVVPVSMYFSGLRQAMAMAFAFPAWGCARKRKKFYFFLVVWCASLFHRSAWVLVVMYPIYHVKITPNWLYILVPGLLLLFACKAPVFTALAQWLWKGEGAEVTQTGATAVLILLILFGVYAFFIPDERKMDEEMTGYRNILLLTIGIQCFAPINMIAMRMNYYFLPFLPILIPKIANRRKRNYQRLANISIVVMTVFFGVYFFWKAYTDADMLQVFPYLPFWKG